VGTSSTTLSSVGGTSSTSTTTTASKSKGKSKSKKNTVSATQPSGGTV
jgi:hypothetical protein